MLEKMLTVDRNDLYKTSAKSAMQASCTALERHSQLLLQNVTMVKGFGCGGLQGLSCGDYMLQAAWLLGDRLKVIMHGDELTEMTVHLSLLVACNKLHDSWVCCIKRMLWCYLY